MYTVIITNVLNPENRDLELITSYVHWLGNARKLASIAFECETVLKAVVYDASDKIVFELNHDYVV